MNFKTLKPTQYSANALQLGVDFEICSDKEKLTVGP